MAKCDRIIECKDCSWFHLQHCTCGLTKKPTLEELEKILEGSGGGDMNQVIGYIVIVLVSGVWTVTTLVLWNLVISIARDISII